MSKIMGSRIEFENSLGEKGNFTSTENSISISLADKFAFIDKDAFILYAELIKKEEKKC